MKNWSRVLSYFRPELPSTFAAFGFMLLSIGASVLKPWPLALIIDHILGSKPLPSWAPVGIFSISKPSAVTLCAVLILLLHLGSGVFSAGQNYTSIKAGLRGLTRLRNQLFDWMQRLSLSFYQRSNQGDLIYRATWDTYALQTLFQQGLFKFLNSFVTVVLMLVIMWRLNAVLALITLAIFPPLIGAMYFFGKKMNAKSLSAHQGDSAVSSLVQQNITSLPVVQSYAREAGEQENFEKTATKAFEKRREQHRLEVIYWLVIALFFGIATAGLTWWGAMEILRGHLTIGELVIFLAYLGQLYEPLNQLSLVGATVADANAGIGRIFEILDTKEQVVQSKSPEPFPAAREPLALAFEGVSFGYQPGIPVLKNLSFEIRPGEVIGLVGPSGSGKTTLLNLIPRFYDVQSGAVKINGKDIRQFALDDLRQNVAFVFQESFLLPGSIAANIAYARPESPLDKIIDAARLANAHDFISKLPQGYETMVGEGSTRLSVGEKQRISIARAFLKDAPILLLDEPTSSLDAETEESVIESLGNLMQNKTTLIAAHRFTTLRYVHRVMILEHGALMEIGQPHELLQREGYFTRLHRLNGGTVAGHHLSGRL